MAEFICEQIAFSHKNALLEYQLLWLAEGTLPALDLSLESPYHTFFSTAFCYVSHTYSLLFLNGLLKP